MPKMTAKYTAALGVANRLGLAPSANQEDLYTALQNAGYFWDSQAKTWHYTDPAQADPPTKLIMIRVWADQEKMDNAILDLTNLIKDNLSWTLVEMSQPYQCRPPKQNESRIYLKYLPGDDA